jgi:hypothetical protein
LEKEEPQTFKILKQKEGFETEDVDYKYRVGMSKYGLWLSRKKKPIFIPDSPKTTTMTTNQPAAEAYTDKRQAFLCHFRRENHLTLKHCIVY